MKLYSMPGSRFAARCRIQILAKGLDIEIENVAYPVQDSYRLINPLGKAPALDTGTQILPESEVICEYLEDRGQGRSLRPDDIGERARMRLVIRILDLYVAPPLEPLYALVRSKQAPTGAQNERIAAGFRHLAPYLGPAKYAVGGRLSLADCALMPIFLHYRILSELLGFDDPINRPPFAVYYEATLADPAVAEVLAGLNGGLRAGLQRG